MNCSPSSASPVPSAQYSAFASKDISTLSAFEAPRGDQFFINRESVRRPAIDATASIDRSSSAYPNRDMTPESVAVTSAPTLEPERDESEGALEQLRKENAKLQDENLNLRID